MINPTLPNTPAAVKTRLLRTLAWRNAAAGTTRAWIGRAGQNAFGRASCRSFGGTAGPVLALCCIAGNALAATTATVRSASVQQIMTKAIDEIRRTAMDPVSVQSLLAEGFASLRRANLPPEARRRESLDRAAVAVAQAGDGVAAILDFAEALKAAGASRPDDVIVTTALRGMASSLGGDSEYTPPAAANPTGSSPVGSLGLEVAARDGGVVVVRPLPGTPAEQSDLRHGDRIIAIDGRPVAGLRLSDVVGRMHGRRGTLAILRLERGGAPLVVTLRRDVIRSRNVRFARLDGIAYLRIDSFGETCLAELHAAMAEALQAGKALDGIVIDLRDNGGGILQAAVETAGDFLPIGETVASLRGRTVADNAVFTGGGDLAEHLPIVVVVNRATAAGAEIMAGALQDHRRAIVLGARTSAHGFVRTAVILPETGGTLWIASARIYLPSGRALEGAGVVPDVPIRRDGPSVDAGSAPAPRPDLPPGLSQISANPPPGEAEPDPSRPEHDFEVVQAVRAVEALHNAPARP